MPGHNYFLQVQDIPSYFLVFHIGHTTILVLVSFECAATSNFTNSELHHRQDFLNVSSHLFLKLTKDLTY